MSMKCPECEGSGRMPGSEPILISPTEIDGVLYGTAAIINIPCPTCEGTGELPDRSQLPNNCAACGEPIAEGQIWCEFHRAAEELDP